MSTGTFVGGVVATLVALAIAGLVAWWIPASAFFAWALLEAMERRLHRRQVCERCSKSWGVGLPVVQRERVCGACREQENHDDRLDDLLRRATATVEKLVHRDENWPTREEKEELEIYLGALGPHVEVAWRAYQRAATALNEALDRADPSSDGASKTTAEARDRLLLAVQAARRARRRS